MAIYEITMADGKSYQVEAGENATEKDIMSAIQSYKPEDTKKPSAYEKVFNSKSGLDQLLIGAGGGMVGLAKGIGQRLGLVDQQEVDQYKASMKPVNESGYGMTGNIVGNVATGLPLMFVPGANTVAGSALIGAGYGAATPTSENESVLGNTMFGAAGGVAGKYVGDKVANLFRGSIQSPVSASNKLKIGSSIAGAESTVNGSLNLNFKQAPNFTNQGADYIAGISPSQNKLLDWGKAKGFTQTPGQTTGNKVLQQVEARMESSPMTSAPFFELKDGNQKALNRIAARSIGEGGDNIDDAMLASAKNRISKVYEEVADDISRPLNQDEIIDKLAKVEITKEDLLPMMLSDDKSVNTLLELAVKGEATGRQLQSLSSKLGNKAYKQMTTASGDRDLGGALFQVKEIVDDALQSGLSGKQLKSFSTARQQYRNLMLLTKRNNVINPDSGDVKGVALAGALRQQDKNGYLFGGNQSDLYNAARYANAFRSIVGDSGTATRTPNNSAEWMASLPLNLTAKAYTSSPSINMISSINSGIKKGLAPNNAALQEYFRKFGVLGGGLLGSGSIE